MNDLALNQLFILWKSSVKGLETIQCQHLEARECAGLH